MTNTSSLRQLDKQHLLRDFSALVEKDRRDTATLLAEIDRRKLYLEHACPSMFAFCTTRFHMSEAIAAKRIRAGRAAYAFPCILDMVALGELQALLSHQIPDGNPAEILDRALDALLTETKKRKAAFTDRPRRAGKQSDSKTRAAPPKLAGRYSTGMRGDAHSLTPKAAVALPNGKSSFTTGLLTHGAEHMTLRTSSSAAEPTINTKRNWSTGRFSWKHADIATQNASSPGNNWSYSRLKKLSL